MSMIKQFKAFVASKPADEVFDPWKARECAGYQFLKAAGYPVYACYVTDWHDTDRVRHELPALIGQAIDWATDARIGETVTFGALHERLNALEAEAA